MLTVAVDADRSVSARLQTPARPSACLVLAHGAGAGMDHPFMMAVADGLQARGIATLRFQFPFAEAGSRRPDRAPLAQAAVRAAVACASSQLPGVALFAGGKSFGGRMTSQAQAEAPLPGVRGLVFFGFPLHPAGKPATTRADHLHAVALPMLFLQGTADALADAELVADVARTLGPRTTLVAIDGADHGFHVRKRTGLTDAAVLDGALDRAAGWMAEAAR